MSFKREGTDYALLHNLTKRRVSDLLVAHIPEDEALLLKNGKYCCTICYHRPIFDTLEMLSLHRKGKKHLQNLSDYLASKQKLKNVVPDNKNKSSSVSKHSLSANKMPYVGYKRKTKINISNLPSAKSEVASTDKKEEEKSEENVNGPSPSSLVRGYVKSVQKKRDFATVVAESRRNVTKPVQAAWKEKKQGEVKTDDETILTRANQDEQETALDDKSSEEKRKRAAYYLHLRSSGWKQDREGKWVKDEEAEFDSDEEEPPEYPG